MGARDSPVIASNEAQCHLLHCVNTGWNHEAALRPRAGGELFELAKGEGSGFSLRLKWLIGTHAAPRALIVGNLLCLLVAIST